MESVKGNCLCHSVEYSFQVQSKVFTACHCEMCRKWGGGPGLVVKVDSGLQMSGEENIGIYDSSSWAERGFCKNCGTHLFYRMKDDKINFMNFQLGTLDNPDEFKFVTEIFIDKKPSCYSFSNATKKLTKKEVLDGF